MKNQVIPFKGENGLYYYVYRITCLIEEKPYYYIGKCTSRNYSHSYYGSGTKIKKLIKEYGESNFKKEFIGFFINNEEATLCEIKYISNLYETDKWCCNLKSGGFAPGYSKELSEQISKSLKGIKHTKEHILNVIESKKKNGTLTHSDETRKKISISVHNRLLQDKDREKFKRYGSDNGFFNKHHTEETKLKLREKATNRPIFNCPFCGKQVKGGSGLFLHTRACSKK
jgi:hypothetical protein